MASIFEAFSKILKKLKEKFKLRKKAKRYMLINKYFKSEVH